MSKIICFVMLFISAGLFSPFQGRCNEQDGRELEPLPTVKFGTLPVLQALPLFVASEMGFFNEVSAKAQLIPFNSAMEKDVAFSAGEIVGYFGDVLTPMILRGNGIPVRMVATSFATTREQRMFAILSAPGTDRINFEELLPGGIAGSSNTIIEYITIQMLDSPGAPRNRLRMIETKNIPIRLQMLLSKQVQLATLPEPLVSLAEMKGAQVRADDSDENLSMTILAFHDDFIRDCSVSVKRFLKAHNQAADYINQHPEKIRPIMNQYCRIPDQLQKNFPIPKFPRLSLPAEKQVMDVYHWLRDKSIIKVEMSYSEIVSDGFIP